MSSKKKLVPVIGKRYVTRGGWITPPLGKHKCDAPIPGMCEGVFEIAAGDDYVMFDANGESCMAHPGMTSMFDLVREYDENAPELPGRPVLQWSTGRLPDDFNKYYVITLRKLGANLKFDVYRPGSIMGNRGLIEDGNVFHVVVRIDDPPVPEPRNAFTVHEYCDPSGKPVWVYGSDGGPVAGLAPTGKKRVVELSK